MTVREVLENSTCEVWITFGEDPNREPPDIKIYCKSDCEEEECLSDFVLNKEVHLMTVKDQAIFISTNGFQQTERSEQMTNADCIRRMNDEQLYEFLSEWECGDIDYSVTFCDLCNEATKRGEVGNVLNLDCDGCRKHWLQRDAVDFGGLMYWKRNTTFEADTPQTEGADDE